MSTIWEKHEGAIEAEGETRMKVPTVQQFKIGHNMQVGPQKMNFGFKNTKNNIYLTLRRVVVIDYADVVALLASFHLHT